jgi:hypothetical protein
MEMRRESYHRTEGLMKRTKSKSNGAEKSVQTFHFPSVNSQSPFSNVAGGAVAYLSLPLPMTNEK